MLAEAKQELPIYCQICAALEPKSFFSLVKITQKMLHIFAGGLFVKNRDEVFSQQESARFNVGDGAKKLRKFSLYDGRLLQST